MIGALFLRYNFDPPIVIAAGVWNDQVCSENLRWYTNIRRNMEYNEISHES